MKKVVVMVSGGGTNLQALIDDPLRNYEISLVISSNKNAYALTRAKKAGIDTLVTRDEDIVTNAIINCKKDNLPDSGFSAASGSDTCKNFSADLIILAGYLSILSPEFCNCFSGKIINIHPSLIPKYCGKGFYGLKVHEAVLAACEKETGATVHFVTDIVDGGSIILQKSIPVPENITPTELQKLVMEKVEQVILPEAVRKILND